MQDLPPYVRRILKRLFAAEVRESSPHLQADYRIAWITVLYAAQEISAPQVSASLAVLGLHPDKVWPAILARRRALLGREYPLFYDAAGNWKPEALDDPWCGESPRKPVQSVFAFPPMPEEDRAA